MNENVLTVEVVMHTNAPVKEKKFFRKLWPILFLTLALGATGCGSDDENLPPPPPGPGPGPAPGPVGAPPPPGGGLGNCIPINMNGVMPIPFSGRNLLINSVELVGGAIPPSQLGPSEYAGMQIGEMFIGGGQYGPFEAGGPDGLISMQIYQQNGPGSGLSNMNAPAEVHGMIELSAAAVNDIYSRFGSGFYNPIPTGNFPNPTNPFVNQGNQICASGIGMHTGLAGFGLTDVTVYLYLNGTVNGMVLRFY